MPPIYPPRNPSWDDTYDDEQFQNNSVSYPCYDGTTDHMMGPAIYDNERPSWSASHLNTPTEETYGNNVSDAYTGNDPYHTQGGYATTYSVVHDQDFAPADDDPEPFLSSAISSGSHNLDFPLTRASTMSTDTSIEPQQGSVDGSDGEDGRQQARRRDPVERYDAFSRFNPPLPVGSRYGQYANISVGETDNMLDDGSSEYLLTDGVKKKKGRKGEPKEMSEHPLSGGHHRRRKDHEDEGSASRQWSSKTDNR